MLFAVALVGAVAGCTPASSPDGGDAGDASPHAWPCPPEWVAARAGGCGPAVILCAPGGGAAAGACSGRDDTTPHAITDEDGGVGSSFYLLPDGATGGGWPERGASGGPPSPDWVPSGATGTSALTWTPAAGIPMCPPGWQRSPDDTCDPMISTACAAGGAGLPGGQCTATTDAQCAASEYADVAAEIGSAPVLHVRANAPTADADGSAAHPYSAINIALLFADSGTWILIAAGEYVGGFGVGLPVHLIGVCARRTTIRSPDTSATISARGAGNSVDVRGVTLTGAGNGLAMLSGARGQLRGARIVSATGVALSATGAGSAIAAQDVAIDDTLGTRLPNDARAIVVDAGASVTGVRVSMLHTHGVSAYVHGARSTLALTDSVVRGDAAGGLGISGGQGVAVTLTRVLLADHHGTGIQALGVGSSATLEDVVVRRTVSASTGGTAGIAVANGASLHASRLSVVGNTGAGIALIGAGTTGAIATSVVRGSTALASGEGGRGIDAESGASVAIERTIVEDNVDAGIGCVEAGSRATISASIVRRTRARPGGVGGIGIGASGSVAEIRGTLVTDNSEGSLAVHGVGASMTIDDSVLLGTSNPDALRFDGHGIDVLEGGSAVARHVLLFRSGVVGAHVGGAGSTLTVEDSVVRGTLTRLDGFLGFGLGAEDSGSISITRSLLDENHALGAIATGDGTVITLTDSVVQRTLAQSDGVGGRGIGAEDGAQIAATRTLVADNREVGASAIGAGAMLVLTDTALRGTRTNERMDLGRGVDISRGATLSATRVLIDVASEMGLNALGADSQIIARDVLITAVRPNRLGFGLGVSVFNGATAQLQRVAIAGVAGSGLGSFYGASSGSRIDAADVFVRGVAPSTIRVQGPAGMLTASGRIVSYGVSAGRDCGITASHAFVDNSGYGFFVAAGSLRLDDAVITGQLDASGATQGLANTDALQLNGVAYVGNATDVIARDLDLPEASSLPVPTPICALSGCP